MSHTGRHLLFAAAWLFGLPLLAASSVLVTSVAFSPLASWLVSAVWALGLAAVFASWALKDAPAHGKPKSLAVIFTVAWLLVLFLAVVPYLFATRGFKAGALAAVKFLCFCLVCAIGWLAVPLVANILGRVTDAI
jgi:hypothetical protein